MRYDPIEGMEEAVNRVFDRLMEKTRERSGEETRPLVATELVDGKWRPTRLRGRERIAWSSEHLSDPLFLATEHDMMAQADGNYSPTRGLN